jgi:hypothetical protein
MVKETERKFQIGEAIQAQDLLLCTASLVKHLQDQPGNPGFWLGRADEIETLIKDLIPQVGHDPKWVDVLSRTMDQMGDSPDLHDALKFDYWRAVREAETYLGVKGTLQDLGYKKEDSTPIDYTAGKLVPAYAKANLSRLHEAYVSIFRELPANPNEFLLIKRVFKASPRDNRLDLSYRVMREFGPIGYQYIGDFVTECAQRNALKQALTMLAGHLNPAKGLPLKTPISLDVDGMPLRLVNEHGGWIIYSVGANRRDEHSAPPPNGVDDFVVHLSAKSVDPKESTREKRRHIGTHVLD